MKATGVLARLLSLLDITLILLGLLMIVLTQVSPGPTADNAVGGPDVVYLFAGWDGSQAGKVFRLGEDWSIGREVRTDSDADFIKIKAQGPGEGRRYMLVFDSDGWYSCWPAGRTADVEKKWGVELTELQLRLPQRASGRSGRNQ